jgi:hypothetical protein
MGVGGTGFVVCVCKVAAMPRQNTKLPIIKVFSAVVIIPVSVRYTTFFNRSAR